MTSELHIITHCWYYSRLLVYHLSSLVLYKPSCTVQLSVVASLEDEKTVQVLDYFAPLLSDNVVLTPFFLSSDEVCRRAIGRNKLALSTEADLVWFCDVDYFFGCGCLDSLTGSVQELTAKLYYPAVLWSSPSHVHGDELIQRVATPAVIDIPSSDFQPRKLSLAIGGSQIVPGIVARSLGYLSNLSRFQSPVKNWVRTSEDPIYRRFLGTNGISISLPQIYRIRHSKRGGIGSGKVEL